MELKKNCSCHEKGGRRAGGLRMLKGYEAGFDGWSFLATMGSAAVGA
jgi:hypothetical protein